jgi:hypothetical protein
MWCKIEWNIPKICQCCFSHSSPFSSEQKVQKIVHCWSHSYFNMITYLLKWKSFHYTGIFKINAFISINILRQLIVTVTSTVRILYHTGCENFYPEDGQDWLQFGLKFTTSKIIPHRLVDFISQGLNQYPLLKYIYITYTFSTEIVIICSCEGVAATQHNVCTFVVL